MGDVIAFAPRKDREQQAFDDYMNVTFYVRRAGMLEARTHLGFKAPTGEFRPKCRVDRGRYEVASLQAFYFNPCQHCERELERSQKNT